jgi:hypothetical protein
MGQENESASQIADAVTDAVSDATSTAASAAGTKKNETLDPQAELFVRRITDSITKSIADLLKPQVIETEEDDDDTVEDSPVKRKRRQAPNPQPAKKPTFWASIGLG